MSLIIPANSAAASGGYAVDNSCRFNRADSPNFTRTPSSASNRRTWTWSGWVKRSGLGNIQTLFNGSNGGFPEIFYFDADDKFLYHNDISGADYKLISSQVFRDVSAWMNIVVAKDTTQNTETNRLKVYVNGSQITMNESALGYPAENFEGGININDLHIIGNWKTNSYYIDGYLAEIAFVDGSQLAPDQFGEFDEDSNIWKPIDVSGLTFGTNGFYLDFENSSALGNDVSGNNNDYTPNNLAATDQSTDTCTNNFATMNPLDNFYAGGTFAEGNLQVVTRDTGYSYNTSTFGVATGKWYWEVKWSAQNTGSTNQVLIGIAKRTVPSTTTWLGSQLYTYGYQGSDGHVKNNNGNATGSSATTYSVGDIISVALDLDNNKIHFAKNGTYTNSSDPAGNSGGVTITAPDSTSGDSGFYFPAFGDGNNNLVETGQFNFGSPPYSESGGETDGNGYGNFAHEPPSGYYALNTKNLAEYG